jgi:predicted phosphodiesterase
VRIVVFSDTHGNRIALDAMLADAADLLREPGTRMVCLGDAVQGGPQPSGIVARLRELGCPVVMGNADAFLLSGDDSGAEPADAERQRELDEVRLWSLDHLTADDRAFIATFQPTVTLPLDDTRNLLGFHGSPHSYDDIILPTTPDEDLQRMLGGFAPHILAGGHTHVQQLRHLGDAFYFGCGSTGFAYRHGQPDGTFHADPWAEYAVLTAEDGRTRLEFRRVPFDVDALIAVYRASGRPYAETAVAQYTY